jgi:hypothetical protein
MNFWLQGIKGRDGFGGEDQAGRRDHTAGNVCHQLHSGTETQGSAPYPPLHMKVKPWR